MFANIKGNLSTILAVTVVVIGSVQTFLATVVDGQPIDYVKLVMYVVVAVIAYFQGSNPNGTKKTPVQVADLNKEQVLTKNLPKV